MEFIGYLVIGLVVGLLARLLMPGPDPIGILGTILVGVVGAIGGAYLSELLPGNNEGVPWIASILVAIALLWIYRRVTVGRRTYT